MPAQPSSQDPAQASTKPDPPADPRRRPFAIARRLIIALLLIYAVYLGVAAVTQETFYFPRYLTAAPPEDPRHGARVESLWIEPARGVRVEAWLAIPEHATADRPVPLIVFTHGNAEIIDENALIIDHYLALGIAVLTPEYRGYGRSTGSPTQAAITDDVLAFIDLARERPELSGTPIIYHGRSIGGGIAGSVAAHRPPDAMIIESSFTSLRSMLARYLIPTPIARNHMDTHAVIAGLDIPILIVHGSSDLVIPVSHAHANHAAARNSELLIFDANGHNDIMPTEPRYADAIVRLLQRIAPTVDPPPGPDAG